MVDRILRITDIPGALWQSKEELLSLPENLRLIYRQQLETKGLLELALGGALDDGPVGGMTEEDTKRHFAFRFSGSCARVQLAVLDPKAELRSASDLFIGAFSGGTLGLLDIPCGSGAASAALLSCVAALRSQGVLPREVLKIKILGGDNSGFARTYADEFIAVLGPSLVEQGIYVQYKTVPWDVLNAESTTNLIHEWVVWTNECKKCFTVAANFSGFLQGESKLKAAKSQLGEVLRWAGVRKSSVMWLEPQTNMALRGFIPRWINWLRDWMPSAFRPKTEVDEIVGTSVAKCNNPLKSDSMFRVHLALLRLETSE